MRYILSRSNIQQFKQLDQCSRQKRRRCREIKINSNWVNKSRDSFTRHGRSVFCWKFISSDKCPKVRGYVSHYSLPQENVGLLFSGRLFGQHFHNCFVYRVESSADSQPRQKQEHNWIKSSRHPPRIDFVSFEIFSPSRGLKTYVHIGLLSGCATAFREVTLYRPIWNILFWWDRTFFYWPWFSITVNNWVLSGSLHSALIRP